MTGGTWIPPPPVEEGVQSRRVFINTARIALSLSLSLPGNVTFGSHALVCLFMKGFSRYVLTSKVQRNLQCEHCPSVPSYVTPFRACKFEDADTSINNAAGPTVWPALPNSSCTFHQTHVSDHRQVHLLHYQASKDILDM